MYTQKSDAGRAKKPESPLSASPILRFSKNLALRAQKFAADFYKTRSRKSWSERYFKKNIKLVRLSF